jgi:hypothetical protein
MNEIEITVNITRCKEFIVDIDNEINQGDMSTIDSDTGLEKEITIVLYKGRLVTL